MQPIKQTSWKKINFTAKQKKAMACGRVKKSKLKKQIRLKQEGAYCVAKLKSQGLWDERKRGSTLKVKRISDMTEEERKEYGVK